ncbi:hypothetical protein ACFLZP_03775 [Patescibacteria group bacterium]
MNQKTDSMVRWCDIEGQGLYLLLEFEDKTIELDGLFRSFRPTGERRHERVDQTVGEIGMRYVVETEGGHPDDRDKFTHGDHTGTLKRASVRLHSDKAIYNLLDKAQSESEAWERIAKDNEKWLNRAKAERDAFKRKLNGMIVAFIGAAIGMTGFAWAFFALWLNR